MDEACGPDGDVVKYIVTGSAAHARVGRLFRGLLEELRVGETEEEEKEEEATRVNSSLVAGFRTVPEDAAVVSSPPSRRRLSTGLSWVDLSPYVASSSSSSCAARGGGAGDAVVDDCHDDDDDKHRVDFLWENARRSETRSVRDVAKCYSHLPFGSILDDKWALARIMGGALRCHGVAAAAAADDEDNTSSAPGSEPWNGAEYDDANNHLVTLESHCFRGSDGFVVFARNVGLLPPPESSFADDLSPSADVPVATSDRHRHDGGQGNRDRRGDIDDDHSPQYQFEDLLPRSMAAIHSTLGPPPKPSNLWVIKDANSNGAGGIWFVDESNVRNFVPPTEGSDCHAIDGVDSGNAVDAPTIPTTRPLPTPLLNPNHRYVAQRYAWPPTLYSGRKCHVRAYALLTCDGRAYLHRRAFLHVANEPFAYDSNHSAAGAAANGGKEEKAETKSEDGNAISFDPSVHITNCCANSHDSSKFIGEICVDLETKPPPQHRCPDPHGIHRSCDVNNYEHDDDESSANTSLIIDNCTRQDELSSPFSTSMSPPLPLGEYLPSISASVASVASSFGPFLRGGEANCGFEYLGLDFVLSSVEENGQGGEKYDDNDMISWKDSNNGYDNKSSSTKRDSCRRRPVAYLLESNAPPSQDTASGLQHAEALHDEVITDLLRMWVLPNVVTGSSKSTRANDDGDEAASPSHDRLDCSGWKCVYTPPKPINANSASGLREKSLILPSKAAILNRIRWALFETRASKEYNMAWKKLDENRSRCDTLLLTGPSTLSTSPALLSRYGEMNTDEDGKNITPAEQFCESSSSGMKKVVSFSFGYHRTDEFVSFVRSQFPYYSTDTTANNIDTTRVSSSSIAACNNAIFFESGGGAQVPQLVANAVVSSLSYRDRSVIGRNVQKKARMALCSLLANNINTSTSLLPKHTHDDDDHVVIMGSNASSLLELLARRMYESGLLCQGDEIVLSSENHLANVTPWLDLAARTVGEDKVKWWTITANTSDIATSKKHDHCVKDRICMTESSSCILSDLITHRTKIVAISHVSNVLGLERDVPAICDLVHRKTKGRGHVVVDGVAAAPHLLSSKAINATKIRGRGSPEWYVVSLHKLFGPHLGCLIGTRSIMEQMRTHSVNKLVVCREENRVEPYSSLLSNDLLAESWESGTMNYEGCSGAIALLSYVEKIGIKAYESYDITCSSQQTSNQITSETSGIPISSYVNIASLCIQHVEDRLVCRLLDYLHSCTFVRIIQDVGEMKVTNHDQGNGSNNLRRIPIISFTHANISSQAIVEHCRYQGVVCRAGKFLSTDRLWEELMIDEANVVRFSLAHYNTLGEIEASIRILEGMEGWH